MDSLSVALAKVDGKANDRSEAVEASSEATGPPLIVVGTFHNINDYEAVRNIFLLATITFRANFREKPFPIDVIFFIFSKDFFYLLLFLKYHDIIEIVCSHTMDRLDDLLHFNQNIISIFKILYLR